MRDNPPAWEIAGQFLGASLRPEELRDLSAQMLAVAHTGNDRPRAGAVPGAPRAQRGQGADGGNALEPLLRELEQVAWRGEASDTLRHFPQWRLNGSAWLCRTSPMGLLPVSPDRSASKAGFGYRPTLPYPAPMGPGTGLTPRLLA